MASGREVRYFEPSEFIDPEIWEDCPEPGLFVFWRRFLCALVAIVLGVGFFWLLDANKRWQKKAEKKEVDEESGKEIPKLLLTRPSSDTSVAGIEKKQEILAKLSEYDENKEKVTVVKEKEKPLDPYTKTVTATLITEGILEPDKQVPDTETQQTLVEMVTKTQIPQVPWDHQQVVDTQDQIVESTTSFDNKQITEEQLQIHEDLSTEQFVTTRSSEQKESTDIVTHTVDEIQVDEREISKGNLVVGHDQSLISDTAIEPAKTIVDTMDTVIASSDQQEFTTTTALEAIETADIGDITKSETIAPSKDFDFQADVDAKTVECESQIAPFASDLAAAIITDGVTESSHKTVEEQLISSKEPLQPTVLLSDSVEPLRVEMTPPEMVQQKQTESDETEHAKMLKMEIEQQKQPSEENVQSAGEISDTKFAEPEPSHEELLPSDSDQQRPPAIDVQLAESVDITEPPSSSELSPAKMDQQKLPIKDIETKESDDLSTTHSTESKQFDVELSKPEKDQRKSLVDDMKSMTPDQLSATHSSEQTTLTVDSSHLVIEEGKGIITTEKRRIEQVYQSLQKVEHFSSQEEQAATVTANEILQQIEQQAKFGLTISEDEQQGLPSATDAHVEVTIDSMPSVLEIKTYDNHLIPAEPSPMVQVETVEPIPVAGDDVTFIITDKESSTKHIEIIERASQEHRSVNEIPSSSLTAAQQIAEISSNVQTHELTIDPGSLQASADSGFGLSPALVSPEAKDDSGMLIESGIVEAQTEKPQEPLDHSESLSGSDDLTPDIKMDRQTKEETAYVIGEFTQGSHSAEIDVAVHIQDTSTPVSAYCISTSRKSSVRSGSKTLIDRVVVTDSEVQILQEHTESDTRDISGIVNGTDITQEPKLEPIIFTQGDIQVKRKQEGIDIVIDSLEKETNESSEDHVEPNKVDRAAGTKVMKVQLERLTGEAISSFASTDRSDRDESLITDATDDVISLPSYEDENHVDAVEPDIPSPSKKKKRVLQKQSSSNASSSVFEVAGVSDMTEMLLKINSLDELGTVMRKAGLQSSNLIFGIDYTASNKYQGDISFGGCSLHSIRENILNPYQQVIRIMGNTLSQFATTGYIPAFGFGDVYTSDWSVFPLKEDDYCHSFDQVLEFYNKVTPNVILSGPTNFAPLILQAIDICQKMGDYHILVIVADGQVTNERATKRAIVDACKHALSIIVVGVGDGPWEMMRVFDDSLPKRPWDNFHFVEFHELVKGAGPNAELKFAVNSLLEIPDQYKIIKQLGLV